MPDGDLASGSVDQSRKVYARVTRAGVAIVVTARAELAEFYPISCIVRD
jgi:hypothetical protein